MIWQLDKGKKRRIWKTLSHSVISILEEAYQDKKKDIKMKNLSVSNLHMKDFGQLLCHRVVFYCSSVVGSFVALVLHAYALQVNLETMEMFTPLRGKLRRTHYEGVQFQFTMTEQDFAVHAKIGHVQVCHQLELSPAVCRSRPLHCCKNKFTF